MIIFRAPERLLSPDISYNRPNMPTSKVNSNYQVTIPKDVRTKANIERGDSVLVEYDEEEGLVKVSPPTRGRRKTWRFGAKLTVADVEAGIERGQFG
jgi:AbrB family looped-hinge helix DNA binding protein